MYQLVDLVCHHLLNLIFILGSLAQICLEDAVVNEKLRDQKFVQRQLDCILAPNDSRCDQFGLQLKSKFLYFSNILSILNCVFCRDGPRRFSWKLCETVHKMRSETNSKSYCGDAKKISKRIFANYTAFRSKSRLKYKTQIGKISTVLHRVYFDL